MRTVTISMPGRKHGLSKNNIVVPGDGRRIFITLHSLIGASYQSNAYYLTCANLADKGAAQITSPHFQGGTLANTPCR